LNARASEGLTSSPLLLAAVRSCLTVRRSLPARARLVSKGQLTVAKEVRERLGLKSGDRVVFEFERDFRRLGIEWSEPD
jgi:AbrB family looped-hinge helix DNA binding protein